MKRDQAKTKINTAHQVTQIFAALMMALMVFGSLGVGSVSNAGAAAAPNTFVIRKHFCPNDYNYVAANANPATECTIMGLGVTYALRDANNTKVDEQTTNLVNGGSVVFSIPDTQSYTVTETTPSDISFAYCVASDGATGTTSPPTLSEGRVIGLTYDDGDSVDCDWYNVDGLYDLTVTKVPDVTTAFVGDIITYTMTVTNNTQVELTNVTLDDPLPGVQWVIGPNLGTVAPNGGSATGSVTYQTTFSDGVTSYIQNWAYVEGTPPPACGVVECTKPHASGPSVVWVVTEPSPAIKITKTADVTTAMLGNTITYTFHVVNTGAFDLKNVKVEDPMAGLVWVTPQTIDYLSVGADAFLNATYTVTQADVDAKSIHNVATVAGEINNDCAVCETVTPTDDVIVNVELEEVTTTATSTVTEPATATVTPTETVTETATATSTPRVTPTPRVTQTATPTEVVTETPTLVVTETPRLTETPRVTETSRVTETPRVTETVTPPVTETATPPVTPTTDPCVGVMNNASGIRALQEVIPATPMIDEHRPESTRDPRPVVTPASDVDTTETATATATATVPMEAGCPSPTPTTPNDSGDPGDPELPNFPVITELPNTGNAGETDRNGFDWIGIVVLLGAAGALIIGSTTTRGKVRGRWDQ